MSTQPLDGSHIEVGTYNGSTEIVLPYKPKGIWTYLTGLFMVLWFGAWATGFVFVLVIILSGAGNLFLYFWFGLWSLGGILVATLIYRIFRPTLAAKLLLNKPNLSYDTGKAPLKVNLTRRSQYKALSALFKRREMFEFDQTAVSTLKLRDRSRLTIDSGITRIDIGNDLTEIEREWLYELLVSEYSLDDRKL